METYAEYLARYRAKADVAASPTLSNDELEVLMLKEHAKVHGTSLHFQYIGDDGAGAPVWRLGTLVLLQDVTTQLAALEDAGSITKIPGTTDPSYSMNPSIRK
jgi:hypothetical protein